MNEERSVIPPASIASVERDTGLSKDTLRVWERRYGFPKPLRDDNGERLYPADQLEKLRLIRRLLDRGVRPGQVVSEPLHRLNERLQTLPASSPRGVATRSAAPEVAEAFRSLKEHQLDSFRRSLTYALVKRGLLHFLVDVVAPLNETIGAAWMDGSIQIFQEHLYSEQMQQLLRQSIDSLTPGDSAPRILLTTLPGEQHKLGLLMAEACMAAEGAYCLSLGAETPALDIAQAARAHRVDIVALSFSTAVPLNLARDGLTDLRRRLDRTVALWAGGGLWLRTQKAVPGVSTLVSLSDIPAALNSWRDAHAAA